MRKAYDRMEVIRAEVGGNFIGICLGFDFCAEHEWGIDNLLRKLSMSTKTQYDSFDDLRVPPTDKVKIYSHGDYKILTTYEPWNGDISSTIKNYLKEIKYDRERDFYSFWDSSDFMVITKVEKISKLFDRLHQAFIDGNTVLTVSGRLGFLGGSGIVIAFYDKINPNTIKDFNKGCDEQKELNALSNSTGIKEKLSNVGLKYFALSPMSKKNANSRFPIVYWLNPYEQHRNNYGWFTVEELEQWIEGKGPIPKG